MNWRASKYIERFRMPNGSPTSEKYAVYTVTSDDESDDSTGSSKENDELTPDDKSSSGLEPFASIPSDMSRWGRYWSGREKCCCCWNVILVVSIISLGTVFVYMHKDSILKNSNGNSTFETPSKVEVSTNPGSTSASPGEIKVSKAETRRQNMKRLFMRCC